MILIRNQLVAQASRLYQRRLKPATTKDCSLNATRYENTKGENIPASQIK
jgi:hypothetical protein